MITPIVLNKISFEYSYELLLVLFNTSYLVNFSYENNS
jgi:hypothetical protein